MGDAGLQSVPGTMPTAGPVEASILIVDDHAVVRKGLRNLLSSHPEWRICGEAEDGEQAVSLALQRQPSIVVMDVSMPRLDGIEATRILRNKLPACQVVIISQNDPTIVAAQAREVGAAAFVTKNNLARNLLPTLEKLIPLRSGQKLLPEVPAPVPPRVPEWLQGSDALGELIAGHDWSQTPLGPIEGWPQSLKTAANLMLNSQHPMWIGWGPQATFLYNDAYVQVLSLAKHPWALGRPAAEVWAEIWDVCGPLADKVFQRGEASFFDEVRLFMNRGDLLEETYYSFSYSPIRDESGKVGGLFCPSTEVTPKVVNARRLRTLSELSANALFQKTTESACYSAIATLAKNPDDVPFSVLYLVDRKGDHDILRQVAYTHGKVAELSPPILDLSGSDPQKSPWPLLDVVKTSRSRVVPIEHVEGFPLGPAQQPLRQVVILPLTSAGDGRSFGVLVAAVNPTSRLSQEYVTFFELLGSEVAAAIQNARAAESERKQMESLAELDRAKTAFFSNVSHEFRTPLTLMLGPLEDALANPDRLSAEHREHLEVAHRNSLRLLQLVNSLLDFSRIEAGRIQASYEAVDIATFTTELASVFRSATERAGLRFVVSCPKIAEPVYVDREMWEKIVFNLLSNALKFTFEGEIEVSLRKADRAVELSVRDTGTGIPEQELPHLFERFHRVKGARGRTFEGSGIGLSLVQELARLHGGTVSVQSALNQGSTFTVSLPLGNDHLPADRIGAPRDTASTEQLGQTYVMEALRWLPASDAPGTDRDVADSNHREAATDPASPGVSLPRSARDGQPLPRILLADDNADMRDYVCRLLSGHYQVEAVSDGELALISARLHPPELILSDVMMPRLDGFGLLTAIRADDNLKSIPLILLSARAGEESRVEGLTSGADDYLVKPFSARELHARVQAHLAMARIRNEAASIERDLRRDADLLAAIVASSDDAIVSKDLNGIITSWNQSAERIFGYTAAEAIGHPITIIIPPDRLDEEAHIISQIRRGDRVDHFHTIRQRKDGSTLEISVTISPVRDSSGRVVGASKVARDISAQTQAERAMRESEERFRAIVETTPDCVKLVAADGTLLHMNSAGLQMVGTDSADAVIGKSIYSIIAPEHHDRFRAFTGKVCSGERGSLEFDIVRLSGARRNMETRAAPLRNPDGSVVQLAITRDVTERKRAEEREHQITAAVVAAQAKFQAVFEQTTVFAGIMSKDGTLIEANKLCLDACGFRADDVLGRMFWEGGWWRNHRESRERISAATPLAARGVPYRETLQYSWADGTERLVDFALYPIVDQKGEVLFLHPTGVDITDLKRTEDNYRMLVETLDAEVRSRTVELEKRNADVLRQSDQLRELSWRLLQTQDDERRHIARELHDSAGQTLTVLGINLAQLVQKAGRNAPELATDAEKIQETVQQLHREIRTTSYLLHPPMLDESGLASALSWYVDGLVERSGLDISLNIPNDFGRLPRDMELVVFRLVQECLTNIHRHSGSKTASICIARHPDKITAEVQDQGRGMSQDRLAEIQSRGSGVGIRGIRERLRQFEGKMNIESDSAGTRILVTIPLRPTEANAEINGAQPLPTAV